MSHPIYGAGANSIGRTVVGLVTGAKGKEQGKSRENGRERRIVFTFVFCVMILKI